MTTAKSLGEFEIMVLAALMRLGDEAYGARIRQEIEKRTGRTVTVGAIYTTLSRMEEKGIVSSRLGPSTPERGGRPKRFFRITAHGTRAFRVSVNSLGNMLEGLVTWPKTAT